LQGSLHSAKDHVSQTFSLRKLEMNNDR